MALIPPYCAFRDALCLRYGWRPPHLPSNCVCGKQYTIEHALSCACGGLPSIRHNELWDITAQLLTETCHGVGIEPPLQPLEDEQLRHRTANREDGARLDIVAVNFWGRDRQNAFFDVRVFNPYAPSHCGTTLVQCYRRNEQEKKRAYEERVREVEHGSFVWRDGPNCNCGLQTDCHPHRRETRPALQQNSILDSLQTQLLTTALCHYVHQRIKVLIPSPSWYDWGSH